MAGVSISHLIIFIASLMIAGAVVGVAFTGVNQFNDAMEDRSVTAAEQLRTDVTIISDPSSNAIYDHEETNVTVLLKNTGDMNLPADARQLDVLLDGQYQPSGTLSVDVVERDDLNWRTSDILALTIDTGDGLDAGDYRLTITVNGDEEVLQFRIEEDEVS